MVVGVGWLGFAILGNASWLIAVAILLGAQFCKVVLRGYRQAASESVAAGIAAGALFVDDNGLAHKVGEV